MFSFQNCDSSVVYFVVDVLLTISFCKCNKTMRLHTTNAPHFFFCFSLLPSKAFVSVVWTDRPSRSCYDEILLNIKHLFWGFLKFNTNGVNDCNVFLRWKRNYYRRNNYSAPEWIKNKLNCKYNVTARRKLLFCFYQESVLRLCHIIYLLFTIRLHICIFYDVARFLCGN